MSGGLWSSSDFGVNDDLPAGFSYIVHGVFPFSFGHLFRVVISLINVNRMG